MQEHTNSPSFSELGLPSDILSAVDTLGYKSPSQIQAQVIPPFLKGQDILGLSQTGSGKTAAFALPLLSNVNTKSRKTQVLVLTPTRELAIQVSTAFKKYAQNISNISIIPIYGGQSYNIQLSALKSGTQIVVGTPGRIMDHIKRKTLDLSNIKTLVLDEADEMLRMGFIDDVEWILKHTPSERQIALFSATMPQAIKSIAKRYLTEAINIAIKNKTKTASTIQQFYCTVNKNLNKLDTLSRILEIGDIDGMIVFVRTKKATEEISEQLSNRGFMVAPINGDIVQKQRERTIEQLKSGKIDILVATDVAARGIDVKRVSHVINYDLPQDVESYVHRVGRTGRAGCSGTAILFLNNREKFFLNNIQRSSNVDVKPMGTPSIKEINQKRIAAFKGSITNVVEKEDINFYKTLIKEYQDEHDALSPIDIAAGLARLLHKKANFLLKEIHVSPKPKSKKETFRKDKEKNNKPRRKKPADSNIYSVKGKPNSHRKR